MNTSTCPVRIDAHQHFWDPGRGDYGWLSPSLDKLYRPYTASDYSPLLQGNGFSGSIVVQAAPTVAETEYLLAISDRHEWIRAVVGWVDFSNPAALSDLDRFRCHPKFRGVRPMIQDIADPEWVCHPQIDWVFPALVERDLAFDALVKPDQLHPLHRRLMRHPELAVVIDHGGKPAIKNGDFTEWAACIGAIARDTNAYCKLSGLVTEAAPDWRVDDLRPYVDHMIEVFGTDRLIFGSDWPVVTMAAAYEEWLEAVDILLSGLSDSAKKAIWGGNAQRAYKI